MTSKTAVSQLADDFAFRIIAAHGLWKYRLHEAISTGRSSFDPTVVALDDRCPLGKSLHGGELHERRGEPLYEQVRQLYASSTHRSGHPHHGGIRAGCGGNSADGCRQPIPADLDPPCPADRRVAPGARPTDETLDELFGTTIETAAQADTATAASEVVRTSMSALAAATEQMSAAIREVAANANLAATVAGQALDEPSKRSAPSPG